MKVWPLLGLVGGADAGASDFLVSLKGGVFAAPGEFERSGAELGGEAFAEVGEAGTDPVDGEFELEENFELMLDIHEFRRLGGPPLRSLGFLEAFGAGDSVFSEL